MDVEPSKLAEPVVNPLGGPTKKSGRLSVAFKKVTVWTSSASNRQVILSPA